MSRKSSLEKIYKVNCENGYFLFKFNSLLDQYETNKNKIIIKKDIDFNSIQRLATGNLSRIDLTIIAKLCNEFGCKIEDIVEYVNNK